MDAGTALNFGRIFRTSYGGDDIDFVNQMNYQYTAGILTMFIVVIGFRQYVGKSIQCWVPQEFTKAWEEYAENICWVSNTYFLLPHQPVPNDDVDLFQVPYIGYYQWVAIVLASQALICWIPHLCWRVGSRQLPLLFQSAREATVPMRDVRRKTVACIVAAMEEIAEANSRHRNVSGVLNKCFGGIRPGRFTLLFFLVRCLFIANSVSQVYLMKRFIGTNDTMFGVTVLEDLMHGRSWELTGHFPRVTFCTVDVRKMGHLQPASYTLQCVLPVNYFIEKVYVFLWFWFVLLTLLTILSTAHWAFNLWWPSRRVRYVRQYLKALRQISNTEERDCARFVTNSLGCDGVFILQVVSRISSDLISLDVVGTLWTNYRRSKVTGKEDDVGRLLDSVHRGGSSIV